MEKPKSYSKACKRSVIAYQTPGGAQGIVMVCGLASCGQLPFLFASSKCIQDTERRTFLSGHHSVPSLQTKRLQMPSEERHGGDSQSEEGGRKEEEDGKLDEEEIIGSGPSCSTYHFPPPPLPLFP